MKDLISKLSSLVSAKLAKCRRADVTNLLDTNQENIVVFDNAQFIEPRGRFLVKFSHEGFVVEGKQGGSYVAWANVSDVISLPSSTSTKKEGEDILAIRLHQPTKYLQRELKHFVWNLSKTCGKGEAQSESEKIHLHITTSSNHVVKKTDRSLFQSVENQKTYLRCYHGTQEGVIYPLKCGLVFIKPIVFIRRSEIVSITAGRGGGSSNTRFIDLMVQLQKVLFIVKLICS